MDGDPMPVALGEMMYPQGFARCRHLTYSASSAIIAMTVMDNVSYSVVEEMLSDAPLEFHELTQAVCRDVWVAVRHLSVPMEDVSIRISKGQELGYSTMHDLFLPDDVVLIIAISTAGRSDIPVLETSIGSSARGSGTLKTASEYLARKLRRPSHFAISLSHTHLFKGSTLRPSDVHFFGALKFASLSRDGDGYYAKLSSQRAGSPTGGAAAGFKLAAAPRRTPVYIQVHMNDIRAYLAPPPPTVNRSIVPVSDMLRDVASHRRSALPYESHAMDASNTSAPTVHFRPLTPQRRHAALQTSSSGYDSPMVATPRRDRAERDAAARSTESSAVPSKPQRMFAPSNVMADATALPGARGALSVSISECDPGGYSSDTSSVDDGQSRRHNVVHVTTRGHMPSHQVSFLPSSDAHLHTSDAVDASALQSSWEPPHLVTGKSGGSRSIAPLDVDQPSSRKDYDRPVASTRQPKRDDTQQLSQHSYVQDGGPDALGVHRVDTSAIRIVKPPTHFPRSEERWSQRGAYAPQQ